MPRGKVGQVIVTCPACGASLEVSVRVTNVRVDQTQLLVQFENRFVDHTCEGRP